MNVRDCRGSTVHSTLLMAAELDLHLSKLVQIFVCLVQFSAKVHVGFLHSLSVGTQSGSWLRLLLMPVAVAVELG
jgi:hypothetical protein